MTVHPAASGSASRWRAAGRLLLLVAGIGLTTWGVCLVAFATSMRNTRLGIPIAFWGVLLGYAAIRGTSFHGPGSRIAADSDAVDAPTASGELELRAPAELVRERDQSARREYELQLELMLRRELEEGLREELAGLRRDVAELRGDVLDAVDGRLRLERVEITRIIGSNLAAMQDDVRVLPAASGPAPAVTVLPLDLGEPPVYAPVPSYTAAQPSVEPESKPGSNPESNPEVTDHQPWRPPEPIVRSYPDQEPEPEPIVRSEPEPAVRAWDMPPRSEAAAAAAAVAAAASSTTDAPASPVFATVRPTFAPEPAPAASSVDPFAGLPRLSSFQLPDLPPGVEVRAASPPEPVKEPADVRAASAPEADQEPVAGSAESGPKPAEEPVVVSAPSGYVGRRRLAAEQADETPSRGRHGADPEVGLPTHRR